ncbi:MAG: hypothetical protein AABX01_01400 [Candidatus Micrarchaeota archaeon]
MEGLKQYFLEIVEKRIPKGNFVLAVSTHPNSQLVIGFRADHSAIKSLIEKWEFKVNHETEDEISYRKGDYQISFFPKYKTENVAVSRLIPQGYDPASALNEMVKHIGSGYSFAKLNTIEGGRPGLEFQVPFKHAPSQSPAPKYRLKIEEVQAYLLSAVLMK